MEKYSDVKNWAFFRLNSQKKKDSELNEVEFFSRELKKFQETLKEYQQELKLSSKEQLVNRLRSEYNVAQGETLESVFDEKEMEKIVSLGTEQENMPFIKKKQFVELEKNLSNDNYDIEKISVLKSYSERSIGWNKNIVENTSLRITVYKELLHYAKSYENSQNESSPNISKYKGLNNKAKEFLLDYMIKNSELVINADNLHRAELFEIFIDKKADTMRSEDPVLSNGKYTSVNFEGPTKKAYERAIQVFNEIIK